MLDSGNANKNTNAHTLTLRTILSRWMQVRSKFEEMNPDR